jgi:hypothetical protein
LEQNCRRPSGLALYSNARFTAAAISLLLYIYEYKSGDNTFATSRTSCHGNTFVSFKSPATFCTKENYALNRSQQKLTARSFSF